MKGTGARGRTVDIDNFGNCITNIRGPGAGMLRDIRVGRRRVLRLADSYSARPEGEALALIGSGGFLEIAVNRGRADAVLALRRGLRVTAWRSWATGKVRAIKDRYKFFGEVALEKRFVTADQLYEALTVQARDKVEGRPERLLGQILLELGHMNEGQIRQVLDVLYPVSE
jgi:hypothetical protein